jgi:hypothetical protein
MKARHMATCAVCGGPFRAKRADPRLCGPKCRKRASRTAAGRDVTDNRTDGAPASVTRSLELVRAQPDPRTLPGRCAGCGMPLGKADPFHNPALADIGDYHHECAVAVERQAAPTAA